MTPLLTRPLAVPGSQRRLHMPRVLLSFTGLLAGLGIIFYLTLPALLRASAGLSNAGSVGGTFGQIAATFLGVALAPILGGIVAAAAIFLRVQRELDAPDARP